MPIQAPQRKCFITIDGLGNIQGLEYANGIRQFCGVPYASLDKRWTRSKLKTQFDNSFHDGTRLGSRCPHPEVEGDDTDDLVPVPPLPHFNVPMVDEKTALVMNIVLPPSTTTVKNPIFVYVHGGSLLYGGAYLAIFDAVKLVSQSVLSGKPIIAINFNYRVGLGGFLASQVIQQELSADGYEGCGNFGFTDQQVAFEWVQTFGSQLGGDIENVTAVGESAGGISISNQLLASNPSVFHRAICMSGLACSIPAWTMAEHEKLFNATCSHFGIDPEQKDVLERLRRIPEQVLANASPLISGVPSGTGNPCLDGWFYGEHSSSPKAAPKWLKSLMLGDVYHEGVIFHLNIMNDTYDSWRKTFISHMEDESLVTQMFDLYGIRQDLSQEILLQLFEHMAGDAVFKIPNYVSAKLNERLTDQNALFLYHFDQRSRIPNVFEGTAYHAHELLYLFGNLEDSMNADEQHMAIHLANAWIDFAYGLQPWKPSGEKRLWKVWGPQSKEAVLTEAEDEDARHYSRFEKMLELGGSAEIWKKWFIAMDSIVNKRGNVGSVCWKK